MPSNFFKNLPQDEQDNLKKQVLHKLKTEVTSNLSEKEIADWAKQNSENLNINNPKNKKDERR